MRPVLPGLSDVTVIKEPEGLLLRIQQTAESKRGRGLHEQPKHGTAGKPPSLEEGGEGLPLYYATGARQVPSFQEAEPRSDQAKRASPATRLYKRQRSLSGQKAGAGGSEEEAGRRSLLGSEAETEKRLPPVRSQQVTTGECLMRSCRRREWTPRFRKERTRTRALGTKGRRTLRGQGVPWS